MVQFLLEDRQMMVGKEKRKVGWFSGSLVPVWSHIWLYDLMDRLPHVCIPLWQLLITHSEGHVQLQKQEGTLVVATSGPQSDLKVLTKT